MDDDSPDDVALRTLARQLFGDHGLGRDTAGERATVARDQRRPTSATSSPTTTAPAPRRSPSPATSTTTRSSPPSSRRSPAMPAGDGRIARARARRGRGRRRDRRRLRAGPPRHRRPVACRATIPTARRSTSSTTSSAAGCRAGCSTRSASAAASPTASTRRRRPTPTPARGRSTPARCPSTPARSRASSAPSSTGWSPTASPTTSWTIAIGYLTGAYEMGLEDTGARMSRLGGMLATLGRVDPGRRAAGPLGGASRTPTCGA